MSEGGGRRAGAVTDQREPRAEEQSPDDVGSYSRRLDVQVHLREVMQGKHADHADDDRGEHDLHDGKILEQKLADENVELSHAALSEAGSRTPNRISRR